MLVMHGVAKLVDTFGLSLFHSTHLHGIGRSASWISTLQSHFMVQPFSNHRAALASGDFAFWWCHHSESTRLLLRVNVLENTKRCCRQPLTAKCGTKQTIDVCSQSVGSCLMFHKQMPQKVYQLAAIKTDNKTMRTMVMAATANRSRSIACMLAEGKLPRFFIFW